MAKKNVAKKSYEYSERYAVKLPAFRAKNFRHLIKHFSKKWAYSQVPDNIFISSFIADFYNGFLKNFNRKRNPAERGRNFIPRYYFHILDYPLSILPQNYDVNGISPQIDYILTLGTKHNKTKYTLATLYYTSLITASVGMVLKYYGNFRKSFKKSYRANMLLVTFIRNTILKFVRKRGYIFIADGFNAKLFSFIAMFTTITQKTNMHFYLIKPRILFGQRIFKKIKSIKRKIQRKNTAALNTWLVSLKKYNKNNYKV